MERPNYLADACKDLVSETSLLADRIREAKLKELRVFDVPDGFFDDIISVAAHSIGTEGAALTFIDCDKINIANAFNAKFDPEPRNGAFCNSTIASPTCHMEVCDAREDERFKYHWSVRTGLVTFYAGVAILSEDGVPLGTVCVYDSKPRRLDEAELLCLQALARVVTKMVMLRNRALTRD